LIKYDVSDFHRFIIMYTVLSIIFTLSATMMMILHWNIG